MLCQNPTIMTRTGPINFVPRHEQQLLIDHLLNVENPVVDCYRMMGATTAVAYVAAKFASENPHTRVAIRDSKHGGGQYTREFQGFLEPFSIIRMTTGVTHLGNGSQIYYNYGMSGLSGAGGNLTLTILDSVKITEHQYNILRSQGNVAIVGSAPCKSDFVNTLPPTLTIDAIQHKPITPDKLFALMHFLGEKAFAREFLCLRNVD